MAYVRELLVYVFSILTKSPAIPQQLYKPASRGLSARGLSAIAELLVIEVYTTSSRLANVDCLRLNNNS